ncbi:hypothetical protein BV394_13090 [Brevirhabdus pacifica]|uniref:Uncharacterized protein n=1 Tax=Brevirhabdus pacifica TaxID=1267768 RepID=A0A1U7DKZ1_9RHOB|nr:hypothetical protein BV394_13090 [Brevirhabdus pacifica]OWU78458.1 hypothetical protein ATO5_06375 [Loktanella sp. 22II-4b]
MGAGLSFSVPLCATQGDKWPDAASRGRVLRARAQSDPTSVLPAGPLAEQTVSYIVREDDNNA